jgi:PAS domain S-box-containing protein
MNTNNSKDVKEQRQTGVIPPSFYEESKPLFVRLFSIIGIVTLAFLGAMNLHEKNNFTGTLELASSIIALLNLILLRYHHKIELSINIILIVMIGVLGNIFYSGGLFNTGHFWFFTFPTISLFLKGTRKGTLWVAALVVFCALIYCFNTFFTATPIPTLGNEFVTFTLSFGVLFALLYICELTIEQYSSIIKQQSKELLKVNVQLLDKVDDSEEQSEELRKFKLAVENTSQHVVITDIDGFVLYANKAVEDLTGYSREEVIGKRPSLWGGLMSKEFYQEMWHTIKDEKRTFAGEITNKRKNGEIYTARTSISPVFGTDGNLKFFVGMETDISKEKELDRILRKEKEDIEKQVVERTRELKEEQARLFASINSLSFSFIVTDIDHNIILNNRATMELFGFTNQKEVSMKAVTEKLGNKFNFTFEANRCANSRVVCEIKEITFGERILRGIIAPIRTNVNSTDKPIGYVFLLEDVTESKVMERSRDEFFAVASHELRTPLTAIRGNAEMMLDMFSEKIQDTDMLEMLKDIDSSSIRLIDIVNDFLEVSRLEQGKIKIKKEEFDALEIINKVTRDLASVVEKKGISLVFKNESAKFPPVYADKNRTEQILLNLIGNSIKFTKEGGITIQAEQIGSFIKISVTDTGIGISEHNQNLLFRKFQQAGENMLARDVTQGTGLGLYICRHLISYMGGAIGLEESELGKGSIFAFTLPIASSPYKV